MTEKTSIPPTTSPEITETWRTRPETTGTFVGNAFLCALLPFLLLWFVPKYVLRHEYVKALTCIAAAVALFAIVGIIVTV